MTWHRSSGSGAALLQVTSPILGCSLLCVQTAMGSLTLCYFPTGKDLLEVLQRRYKKVQVLTGVALNFPSPES